MLDNIEGFLVKHQIAIILFSAMAFTPSQALASGIGTETFQPLMDLIYTVLKIAGAIIAVIGFAKLLLSFSNEQPEGRYSGVMQILTGIAMFFSDQILSSLGITF
ncbi:MAG: hypothetical protein LBV08_09305 [Clostridiales bacterium]|jgi:putative Mn2+ efflux pump MntP|nr:hypothetical protein [Clostridiales bacterium]